MAKKILSEIMASLEEIKEDQSVPKNIKLKIEKIIEVLNENSDLSIRIDKAMQELDEIADDTNIQPYIRTQLWNVASLLENAGD